MTVPQVVETHEYSLGAQCAAEALATAFAMYLSLSVVANALLAKTKGQQMGWGFVSFGFGLAFGAVIVMFSFISANVNPAMCLALWVIGQISAGTFLALSASEFAGAFLGAVLVWLHFLPHFKTVPEPAAENTDDLLLRSRDALPEEALSIASYNTREDRRNLGVRDGLNMSRAVRDVRYYFRQQQDPPSHHDRILELALGRNELKATTRNPTILRRHSVEVSDVHRRLNTVGNETFHVMMNIPHAPDSPRRAPLDSAHEGGGSMRSSHSMAVDGAEGRGARGTEQLPSPFNDAQPKRTPRQARLYEAALLADQNAKLAIFCTRPGIYAPVFNFLAEFLCTTTLVFGSLMMGMRGRMLYEPARGLFQATEGMWIGFFIFLCVLGLGGPTGIAANPARDLAPRLAHWILPIPGKGSSEWHYSWIPVLAPLAGGIAAGGLYLAVQHLNQSTVPSMALCS